MNFHKCVSENHDNPKNCVPKQIELSNCIKEEIPSFQKILTKCGQILSDYDNCLRTNTKDQNKCLEKLENVRNCASECINLKESTPANNLQTKE